MRTRMLRDEKIILVSDKKDVDNREFCSVGCSYFIQDGDRAVCEYDYVDLGTEWKRTPSCIDEAKLYWGSR